METEWSARDSRVPLEDVPPVSFRLCHVLVAQILEISRSLPVDVSDGRLGQGNGILERFKRRLKVPRMVEESQLRLTYCGMKRSKLSLTNLAR
jgi:hypothetical protein